MHTTETGLIGAMMDIGACIALSVIVYFGESVTKARWIACGMLFVATGSLIFVVPQFVAPNYTFGEEEWNYCGNVSVSKCEGSPLRQYRYTIYKWNVFNFILPIRTHGRRQKISQEGEKLGSDVTLLMTP